MSFLGSKLSESWAILINLTGLDVFRYQAGFPQGRTRMKFVEVHRARTLFGTVFAEPSLRTLGVIPLGATRGQQVPFREAHGRPAWCLG